MTKPGTAYVRHGLTMATAMLTMFFLGAIYAYGVLLPEIMRSFGWHNSIASLPQSVLLFVYAIGMGIGGALQDRSSPTRIAVIGGLAFGLGLLIASKSRSLTWFILSYGVLGGIGFGFAYVAAVTAAMKSYPRRRGTVAGLVVGSFGLGSAVWAPLAQSQLAELGWQGVLFRFGLLLIVLLPLLGLGIRSPWHPHDVPGQYPEATGVTLRTALRTPLFWIIFLAYMLVTSAGLMWLNHYKIYGTLQGIPAAQAAFLVAITSIGSGTGRILMGWLSDRIGRFSSLIGASVLAVHVLILLALALPGYSIFILAGIIGFVFGTWLCLYGPTATDIFGMRAAGAIYGTLYLSYGLGGLIGPTLGGYLKDISGNYRLAFLIAAGFCAVAAVLFAIARRMPTLLYQHPPGPEEQFPV